LPFDHVLGDARLRDFKPELLLTNRVNHYITDAEIALASLVVNGPVILGSSHL
jgi:hypothetical protein